MVVIFIAITGTAFHLYFSRLLVCLGFLLYCRSISGKVPISPCRRFLQRNGDESDGPPKKWTQRFEDRVFAPPPSFSLVLGRLVPLPSAARVANLFVRQTPNLIGDLPLQAAPFLSSRDRPALSPAENYPYSNVFQLNSDPFSSVYFFGLNRDFRPAAPLSPPPLTLTPFFPFRDIIRPLPTPTKTKSSFGIFSLFE